MLPLGSGSESLELQLVFSFDNDVEFVAGYIAKALIHAARPTDLNLVGMGTTSQPEVSPQIALRHEAATTLDLANL